jgi:hypothetical protein
MTVLTNEVERFPMPPLQFVNQIIHAKDYEEAEGRQHSGERRSPETNFSVSIQRRSFYSNFFSERQYLDRME